MIYETVSPKRNRGFLFTKEIFPFQPVTLKFSVLCTQHTSPAGGGPSPSPPARGLASRLRCETHDVCPPCRGPLRGCSFQCQHQSPGLHFPGHISDSCQLRQSEKLSPSIRETILELPAGTVRFTKRPAQPQSNARRGRGRGTWQRGRENRQFPFLSTWMSSRGFRRRPAPEPSRQVLQEASGSDERDERGKVHLRWAAPCPATAPGYNPK